MKELITQEQMQEILDKLYDASLKGLPKTESCYELALNYSKKYLTKDKAIEKLVSNQILKCTTSGFLTSLGGLITLPVAIPANISSVLYVQIRMIATIAIIAGFEPSDDEVKTLVYVCLAGISITDVCKQVGIQFSNKFTYAMIKKIPGTVLTKINQKVGFRFITKFGTKGIINLGKLVPVLGGLIGGGMDFASTRLIADRAYKTFILQDFS